MFGKLYLSTFELMLTKQIKHTHKKQMNINKYKISCHIIAKHIPEVTITLGQVHASI